MKRPDACPVCGRQVPTFRMYELQGANGNEGTYLDHCADHEHEGRICRGAGQVAVYFITLSQCQNKLDEILKLLEE